MPIRTRYEHFEFPKDLNLEVFKELPEGFEQKGWLLGPKTAWTVMQRNEDGSPSPIQQPFREMTYCQHCEGWIEARPHEHQINNLDGSRLCGRKGTEYYCARCAQEIHFSGMMS